MATVSVAEIDLVATDLDGTLWDSSRRVHPRTLRALGILAAASIPVLAATGRRAASAWPVMEANGIALPTVLLDGALGKEFGLPAPFHRHPFSRAAAFEVLQILEELEVSPCINVDKPGRDVVVGREPSTHPGHLRFLEPWIRGEDPWTAVETLDVFAFTLAGGEPSAIRELVVEVTARAPLAAAVHADRAYGGLGLSLRPFGVHKWAGVLAYCAATGRDATRVLAVGDSDNDLELLEGAALSFATADGSATALEHSDHLLAPPSEGGWAEILEFLGLSEE